jgi:hypothetical protein
MTRMLEPLIDSEAPLASIPRILTQWIPEPKVAQAPIHTGILSLPFCTVLNAKTEANRHILTKMTNAACAIKTGCHGHASAAIRGVAYERRGDAQWKGAEVVRHRQGT